MNTNLKMFPNFRLVLLICSCIFSKAFSELQSKSYADGNLGDIFLSPYEISAYSELDPRYMIPPPNNGPDSGGAFVIDVSLSQKSQFVDFKSMDKTLEIQISYFCDTKESELGLQVDWSPLPDKLCGGEDPIGVPGQWSVSKITHTCAVWTECAKLLVIANSKGAGGAIGVEYIIVATDDSTLPPDPTTAHTEITTTVPDPTTITETTTPEPTIVTETTTTQQYGIGCYSCFDCPAVDDNTPLDADAHFFSCFTATMSSGDVTYVFRGGSDKHHINGSCRQEDGAFSCYCTQDKCNDQHLDPTNMTDQL